MWLNFGGDCCLGRSLMLFECAAQWQHIPPPCSSLHFCAGLAIHGAASLQRNSVASTGSAGGGSSVEHEPTPDTPLIPPAPAWQQGSPAAFEGAGWTQMPANHLAADNAEAASGVAAGHNSEPGVPRATGVCFCGTGPVLDGMLPLLTEEFFLLLLTLLPSLAAVSATGAALMLLS